jgi:hypothetical protein
MKPSRAKIAPEAAAVAVVAVDTAEVAVAVVAAVVGVAAVDTVAAAAVVAAVDTKPHAETRGVRPRRS